MRNEVRFALRTQADEEVGKHTVDAKDSDQQDVEMMTCGMHSSSAETRATATATSTGLFRTFEMQSFGRVQNRTNRNRWQCTA